MAHDSNDEQHNCRVIFDPAMYDGTSVCTFLERYRQLLAAVSRHPDKAVSDLLVIQ
jgi:hypothetical protein